MNGIKHPTDYYISRKEKLLKQFKKIVKVVSWQLEIEFSSNFARKVFAKAEKEFVKIIPNIPYIGGAKNPFTQTVVLSAISLSFYLSLRTFLKNKILAKQLTFMLVRGFMQGGKGKKKKLWLLSKLNKIRFHKLAKRSQEREFPDDYVFDFLKGKDEAFDFGLNYTECAVCKMNDQIGEEDFTEVICAAGCMHNDFEEMGFKRTKSLASGDDHCDFRFSEKRTTKIALPKYLKRSKIKKNFPKVFSSLKSSM